MQKRLLWIAKDRTEAVFNGFFDELGKARSKAIKFICFDMWWPYLNVIKERVSQAIHILVRFPIVSMLKKAIDEVRSGEYKQMRADVYEPVLKKSGWCLLKCKENLTENQKAKLKDLSKYNRKSVRAYLQKEYFQ